MCFPTFVIPETLYVSALILSTKRPRLDPSEFPARSYILSVSFLLDSVSVSSLQNHCQFFQVHTGQGQRHWMTYLLASLKQFTYDNVTLSPLLCRVNMPGVNLRLKTGRLYLSLFEKQILLNYISSHSEITTDELNALSDVSILPCIKAEVFAHPYSGGTSLQICS